MTRAPAAFVSHGSPMIAIENDPWRAALRAFAEAHEHPRAVAVVSGHWEERSPVRVAASPSPQTIHDFSGFPDELYRIRYPARGDPALAARIVERLFGAGIPATLEPERGLDHGAWVPLRFLYPEGDVPVVEISQPMPRAPTDALGIGAALAPLREEGVLLLGTGGIVHNLRRLDFADAPGRDADWARAFDTWIAGRLAELDVAAITSYRSLGPHAELAVPTADHFDPIFVVLGAAFPGERVTTIYEGFRYGTISMRSFALDS